MTGKPGKWLHFSDDVFPYGAFYQAMFDGYSVGDTLLEGITFIATVNEDHSMSVEVDSKDVEYFSDFNEKKWLKAALDFAENTDVFKSLDDKLELVLVEHQSKENV